MCNELGVNMSTAITMFIKAAVREQGIPFALSINDYNKETKKVIEDARSMNYSKFDEEKGSNYDKLWQNSAVVEQVDNTLLTIADTDQNVTSQIINATKY